MNAGRWIYDRFKANRPRSKYKNEPCIIDGIRFMSRKEGARYSQLKMMLMAKTITDLQLQVAYRLDVNGQHVCTYKADFVYNAGGREVVEDCKGFRTREYMLKKKLMKVIHGIDILET